MTRPAAYSLGCGGIDHWNRRSLLKMAGLSGLCWLTPLANRLALAHQKNPRKRPKSVIVLWLEGAPSQLETFDPHQGSRIAAGSKARDTNVKGIQLGEGLEQTAELMDRFAIVRSVTSREGDHERAIYNVKTGFRPDPTLVHPAIGSIICHQLLKQDEVASIPNHISLMPTTYPGRGGYLGDAYDAFKVNDPMQPVPDVRARVEQGRFDRRIDDLRKMEALTSRRFGDQHLDAALRMMSSDQLKAFDVSNVPESERLAYGDSPFGRSCLAAVQLIEAGVRCVEVTLTGWDSHANNHEIQAGRIGILDPALASMVSDLEKRDLLDDTIVVCGGEFGRTPQMNLVEGRDHWPHGFSIALAGGGIVGGQVIGETNPDPKLNAKDPKADLKDPHPVEDIHASILSALEINFKKELDTPVGRPMKISEGKVIKGLFDV